jgi:hypothetical protein
VGQWGRGGLGGGTPRMRQVSKQASCVCVCAALTGREDCVLHKARELPLLYPLSPPPKSHTPDILECQQLQGPTYQMSTSAPPPTHTYLVPAPGHSVPPPGCCRQAACLLQPAGCAPGQAEARTCAHEHWTADSSRGSSSSGSSSSGSSSSGGSMIWVDQGLSWLLC